MTKHCFLTLAFFAVISSSGMAQTLKLSDDYSAPVFSNTWNESIKPKKKKRKPGRDNVVKLAPLGFVTGTFPVYYERRINDFFSTC